MQRLVHYLGNWCYSHNPIRFLLKLNTVSEDLCYGNVNTHYAILKECLPLKEVKSLINKLSGLLKAL